MKSLNVQVGMSHIRTVSLASGEFNSVSVFHSEITVLLKGMKTRTAACETYGPCPPALRESSKMCSHHGTIYAVILWRLCDGILKGMLSHKSKEVLR